MFAASCRRCRMTATFCGWFLLAEITDPIDDHLGLCGNVTCRQLNGGDGYVIQAKGLAAVFTYKVDVVVLMVPLITSILANSIFYAVIGSRYGMQNPLLHKRLQGPVY